MNLWPDQILETAMTRDEADKACSRWARLVVELGMQDARGVYVKPYRIPGRRNWWFAICVGPQD